MDEQIIEHMKLAKRIALKFSYRCPHLRDDLIAEAYIHLVKGVRTFKGPENKLRYYLIKVIKHRLQDYTYRESTIPLHRSTHKRLKEAGKLPTYIRPTSDYDPTKFLIAKEQDASLQDYIVLDDLNTKIIDLRMEGASYDKISVILNIPKTTVHRRLKNLRKRFKDAQT